MYLRLAHQVALAGRGGARLATTARCENESGAHRTRSAI